uniref:Uncharacterized protein n=1 Tax=Candidatus Kentrum eta TaxID=2126337 RepID=A0A450V0J1_9GAMM|nr:MAG: hypothetical protein BECKH772A_GA0070896_1002117 [Candidatus Kentron sp. H]VFJ91627.1 MAG: hypothetical protein BECKH772B_GA0070898_1001917 [Candidatus Kentron sp. H]VFJ98206.1 MAG: hypothetical protein BECKH772C_GA0070978_1001917 [Candidatus Kentron sp. H]
MLLSPLLKYLGLTASVIGAMPGVVQFMNRLRGRPTRDEEAMDEDNTRASSNDDDSDNDPDEAMGEGPERAMTGPLERKGMGSLPISAGDTIGVRLRARESSDGGKTRMEYDVIEVIEHNKPEEIQREKDLPEK